MAVNPVTWVTNNLTLTVTGVLALVLIAWAYDAYREADDRREALGGFNARAKRATGGWLNVALVTLVAVVGGMAQSLGQFAELFGWLAGFIPEMPVVSAGLFGIGLGGLGLSGWLELHPLQYVGFAGLVLVLAVAWRADLDD